MSMMVETHLGPNMEVQQIQEVTGVIWVLKGNTLENDPYITPN